MWEDLEKLIMVNQLWLRKVGMETCAKTSIKLFIICPPNSNLKIQKS